MRLFVNVLLSCYNTWNTLLILGALSQDILVKQQMECNDEWNWKTTVLLYGKNTTELTGKFFTEEYKLRTVLESIPTGHDYFSS